MRLMNRIIKPGVRTKVLMLSATPVNNRFYDLRNQLALAYEGKPKKSMKSWIQNQILTQFSVGHRKFIMPGANFKNRAANKKSACSAGF